MKKPALFIFVLFMTYGIFAQEKLPIIGAWNLVQAYTKSDNRTLSEFPVTYVGSQCKIWTVHNYLFVGRFKEKGTLSDSYGGGTYTLDGNKYEEIIQYNNNPRLIDKKVIMLLEIKNDTLIQTFPVSENGEIMKNGQYFIYKYTRIR